MSKETPFADPSRPRPKSAFAAPFAGSGPDGAPPKARGRPRGGAGPLPPRPELNPPYAVSLVQHSHDFGKSSTQKHLGKQATSRFYNAIGGWSAGRC